MIKIIAIVIGLILLGFLGWRMILSFERANLYHPSSEWEGDPSLIGCDYRDLFLKAPDGTRLHGWYIPGTAGGKTVLFCHGNAGNITHRLEAIGVFNRLGLNLCIFDYRGYGKSFGRPSEEGTYRDAALFYDYLKEEAGADDDDIILFGRSLGGAIAAELARRKKARALICEAAFTSTADMARLLFPGLPVKIFVTDRYETIEKVKTLSLPKLFIHSRDDELVPFSMGRRLYGAARSPKRFCEIGGEHADGFRDDGERYTRELKNFLAELD